MARGVRSIRHILAATDLQADSRAVIEAAGWIAKQTEAGVELFYVLELPADARSPAATTMIEQAMAEARRALEVQAETLVGMGVQVDGTQRVQGGPAHRRILDRLKASDADLVVIGSRSRTGAGRRLGSTADRVLRTSPVPCLIVRESSRFPIRRAAVLVDFSAASRKALRQAAEFVMALGGAASGPTLDILHVGDERLFALDATLEWALQVRLDREAEAARKCGLDPERLTTRLLWGRDPLPTLLEAAGTAGYELLIVGTHGRGPLVRALVGSVALGLCQSAPCAMLIVPPRS